MSESGRGQGNWDLPGFMYSIDSRTAMSKLVSQIRAARSTSPLLGYRRVVRGMSRGSAWAPKTSV